MVSHWHELKNLRFPNKYLKVMFFKYNNKYERITNIGTRTQQPAGDRWQALQGRADQQGSQEHQEGTVELRVRSVDLLEL